jgi:heme/copper-type cytochrome/quinol oxidase subunit 4
MAAFVKVWMLLVMLTLVAIWAGAAQGHLLPPVTQAGLILAVAGFKASTILRYFLGLRMSSGGWRALFSIYLIVLCGTIFVAYLAGCVFTPGQCDLPPGGGRHE